MSRTQQIADILSKLHQVKAKLGLTTLLSIDGPSGAGKTTLALELHHHLEDSLLIHMDDLYAGWQDALSDDLYTRISSDILIPLSNNSSSRYQKYNWYSNQFEHWQDFSPQRFLILEGVGSAALPHREWISLCIYLDVSDSVGLQRVRSRDGNDIARFIPAWQSMQQEHFSQHQTLQFADIVLRV